MMLRVIVLFFIFWPHMARADEWPKLDNTQSQPQCAEIEKMANAVFHSNRFYLYDIAAIPNVYSEKMALKPSALDISGGDGLVMDPTVFEKIKKPSEYDPRSFYWQREAQSGFRFVIDEESVGWRGDMYSLYAVKDSVSSDQFLKQTDHGPALVSQSWRPPLITQDADHKIWAIDVGQPFNVLSDWIVYAPDMFEHVCVIHFRPDVKDPLELLPKPVSAWARLLDGTLGDGKEEGTLQPTARARLKATHNWVNIALRPWALNEPYNVRDKVDAELKKWSAKSPAYRKQYKNIQVQYPKAQNALTTYYKTHFDKSDADAKTMAAHAMDVAYRSYFVFSSN